jgi:hypothetical protein
MFSLRSALLGLGMLLAVSATQAQEARVKANIPFDFMVGNKVLPAGEYIVSPRGGTNQVILIRAEEGSSAALATTLNCASSGLSSSTKLVFHTMGGQYFLWQVWTEGYDHGRQLPKSSSEVQMAKNHVKSDTFVLAANLTR